MWLSDYGIGQCSSIEIKSYFVKKSIIKKEFFKNWKQFLNLDMQVHGGVSTLLDKR